MVAMLAAQTGMAAFVQATLAWLNEPRHGLKDQLDQTFVALRKLAGQASVGSDG